MNIKRIILLHKRNNQIIAVIPTVVLIGMYTAAVVCSPEWFGFVIGAGLASTIAYYVFKVQI